jgi:hypothetical protein
MTISKLDHALELAAQGFYVFPIVAGKKAPPAVKNWQVEATRNADKILYWWSHADFNIGISTSKFGDGEALLVVDVDNKGNKRGDEELLRHELEGRDMPATLSVRTPTGGRHLFYRCGSPVRQGVDLLAVGLDIRSRGGYVVGAGSTTADGAYSVDRDGSPAPAPAWVVDQCGRPTEKQAGTGELDARVNPDAALARALHYLLHEAPIHDDPDAYKVACRVKDFGVDLPTAIRLMEECWDPRCDPPRTDNTVDPARNAYAYGLNSPGAAAPETVFDVVVPDQPAKPALYFELFRIINPDLQRPALIRGLLDERAMSVVYGESNTGKTFWTLDVSLHIAMGREWQGRPVQKGGAVYVAAEGGGAIRKRIVAFRQHYTLEGQDIPFALVPCAVDLLNPRADTGPLIELIAEAVKQCGIPVTHLTIDTLARAIGGGNENASEDMGAFVRNVDRIRQATGTHITVVHHSGKDRAKGARGHSSLRAATDTEIEIGDFMARVTKQRDMEHGAPLGFQLEPVTVGKDLSGADVRSCVVLPRAVSAAEAFGLKPLKAGSQADIAMAAIQDLTMSGRKVTADEWRAEFLKRAYPEGDDKGTGTRAFTRAQAAIADRVTAVDGWVSVIE